MSFNQQAALRTDDLCGTDASASIAPQQASPSSRTAPRLHVDAPLTGEWRAEAIRRAADAADKYGDEYAMTGCRASLDSMNRADALLRRLIGGCDATRH